MVSPRELKAVVVGGTGAVGTEIVGQLLSSQRWGQVTVVGRREVDIPPKYEATADVSKLKSKLIPNLDATSLEEAVRESGAGADTLFYALGTTRPQAGSADAFISVERGLSKASFSGARSAGPPIPHIALISAQGANANLWAGKSKPLHALLYARTKGEIEQDAKSAGFAATTILQPGLLIREGRERFAEKLFAKVAPSVPTSVVARAAIRAAERVADGGADGETVLSMSQIKKEGAETPA